MLIEKKSRRRNYLPLCRKVSKFFHSIMKKCEHLSGDAEVIEAMQTKIKSDIDNAKFQKEELSFIQENIITKEQHIENLYSYIGFIGVNFRSGNFEEVDRALRRINL